MEAPNQPNGLGTWRRYKLGQAQFTSWLKQTAEKLVTRNKDGEANTKPTAADDADPTPQQSRRQKKKKTKDPNSGGGFGLTKSNGKFVHWSQLEVLAQRIVDHATPDDIPDAALNILRDVVGLRKKSFSFFSSSAKESQDEKVKQSNANHAHIISVLERVLAKLEALAKAGRSRKRAEKSEDKSQVTTADLSNMFAYLELQTGTDAAGGEQAAAGGDESEEEVSTPGGAGDRSHNNKQGSKKKGGKKGQKQRKQPAETQLDTPGKKRKGGDTAWVDKFRFGLPGEDGDEDEDDEFDLYMMVYCFFEDFNAIRNHVAERWCDYWYDRSVPLDTLAVITNAAFELFHQLEYDLVRELRPLSPALARYDFMMSMLFYHYGIEHIDYDSYDELSEAEKNERIWRDEADWLALASHFTLQQALEMIPPGKVPMMPPSQRSPTVYGANSVEEWKKFEGRVTHQIITEGAHLKALKINGQEPPVLPTESVLLLDFQECLKRNSYNSSLIFSLHLWVDIRNIIETDHDKPFEEMQKTGKKLMQALEGHNPTKYVKDPDLKRTWLGRTWEAEHYMVEDFLFDDKKARLRQVGLDDDPEPFFLLKHEPVWAGLLDFRARLVHSQLGHEFVLLSSVVDAAAGLYHAARAADPENVPVWTEMQAYVATFADDSALKTWLGPGQGAGSIIRGFARVYEKPAGHRKGAQPVELEKFVSAVAVRESLYQRYCFDERRITFVEYLGGLTAQRLQIRRSEEEKLLKALESMDLGKDDDDNDNTHENDNDNVPNGNTKNHADQTALVKYTPDKQPETEQDYQRKADLLRLSPVEMLRVLDETVTSQVEGLLTLDYFELFDRSVALLEAVVGAFGSEMEAELGSKEGESVRYLEKVPVILGGRLSEGGEGEVVGRLVGCVGEFLG
ncbi:hypothetical protein B0J18DRAFT_295543 [Chaetomium sp. MPI-SDFR-AT-0129]|nr:hypothetical protein B0J18DRAFT_295543 [Chaetomium sp. MPI-SDFR-AT-0129]